MDSKSLNNKFQDLFFRFNNDYFGSKLPHYRIQVVDYVSRRNPNMRGKIYRRQRLIRLTAAGEEFMISILLHEMAHAANKTDGHGKKFLEILKNLKQVGAPTMEGEFPDPEYEIPKRITKRLVRGYIEDALLDTGGAINLWQFSRWFVVECGGHSSPTALLREYPWIRKVFSQERRAYLRVEELRKSAAAKFREANENV